jgi:hypothetical protein
MNLTTHPFLDLGKYPIQEKYHRLVNIHKGYFIDVMKGSYWYDSFKSAKNNDFNYLSSDIDQAANLIKKYNIRHVESPEEFVLIKRKVLNRIYDQHLVLTNSKINYTHLHCSFTGSLANVPPDCVDQITRVYLRGHCNGVYMITLEDTPCSRLLWNIDTKTPVCGDIIAYVVR